MWRKRSIPIPFSTHLISCIVACFADISFCSYKIIVRERLFSLWLLKIYFYFTLRTRYIYIYECVIKTMKTSKLFFFEKLTYARWPWRDVHVYVHRRTDKMKIFFWFFIEDAMNLDSEFHIMLNIQFTMILSSWIRLKAKWKRSYAIKVRVPLRIQHHQPWTKMSKNC